VRELKNTVQAYSILRSLPPSSPHHDPRTEDALVAFVRSMDVALPYAQLKDSLVDRFQASYLAQLLVRTGGNQTAASRISGLDRTYLGRLLAKYGLSRP
jgi:DNA-binding NtrC family response regulator